MKILFLGGDFSKSGGTERVASIIPNELARRTHDVVVAGVSGGKQAFFPLDCNVKVTSIFNSSGRNLFRFPKLVAKLRKLLIEEKPDVLVVVESMLTLFTIPAIIGLPIKHICWEHFNFKSDLGRKGRRIARQLAARFCDVVVTLSDRDRRYWLRHTMHKATIVTIPNPSPFAVVNDDLYSIDSRVVLAMGRLVEQKGYDLLLAAWRQASPKAPGWRLRIVGDGPDREALVALASSFGIASTVDFVEATADVRKHYKEAAIYCLSSRFEGFGMVLVEAMSFGIPAVSFDCDAGPAEVLEGTGSRLVGPEDVEGLGDAMVALIENPDVRRHVSTLSRIKAERYQPDFVLERWLKIL